MLGAARYASLWFSDDKKIQQATNLLFTFYSISITYKILKTPRLSNELFKQYDLVAKFKARMHNVLI